MLSNLAYFKQVCLTNKMKEGNFFWGYWPLSFLNYVYVIICYCEFLTVLLSTLFEGGVDKICMVQALNSKIW